MRYYEFIVEYKTEITKNKFGDKILDKLQIQNIIDLKPDIEAGRPMSKPTDYQQLALHIMGVRGLDFNGPGSPWESVDQELFDKQSEDYKKDLMDENSLVVTLEAGSVTHWQKYTKDKELNIGIDQFGESAPYKELYNHFKIKI